MDYMVSELPEAIESKAKTDRILKQKRLITFKPIMSEIADMIQGATDKGKYEIYCSLRNWGYNTTEIQHLIALILSYGYKVKLETRVANSVTLETYEALRISWE